MRVTTFLGLLLVCLWIPACAPAGGQPAFNHPTLPSTTAIPMQSKPAHVAATLNARMESFDVSPDLKTIALATSFGVRLYDFRTQKFLRSLNDGEEAFSVAWSPDGSKLAVGSGVSGGNDTVSAHLLLWDTSSWKMVLEPDFGQDMLNEIFRAITWSPDNRSIAISTDADGVLVLDAQTGQVISHQTDFSGSVLGISWSADGSRLVATNDMAYGLRRWRVSDDQWVRLFDRRASSSTAVAWSPDGKRIASGHYLGGICLWTAATNRCDGFIKAHRQATFSLAWSPDGSRLATGGGVIRVWDTNTGELMKAFGQDDKYIYSHMEWPAMDQSFVTLQTGLANPADTVVRIWDLESSSIIAEFRGKPPGE